MQRKKKTLKLVQNCVLFRLPATICPPVPTVASCKIVIVAIFIVIVVIIVIALVVIIITLVVVIVINLYDCHLLQLSGCTICGLGLWTLLEKGDFIQLLTNSTYQVA